jgi:hypothetical protein
MERETGFEPATPALARQCSTTELFPHRMLSRTYITLINLPKKILLSTVFFNELLHNAALTSLDAKSAYNFYLDL